MGIDKTFERAYAKACIAAGQILPQSGGVFVSVRDADKAAIVPVAKGLAALGFKVFATRGTRGAIVAAGVACETVFKISEGRPNAQVRGARAARPTHPPLPRSTRRSHAPSHRPTADG